MADFTKDPDAVLDWKWDWSSWLQSGETISTKTVTISSGLALDSSSNSTTSVTAWISGGTTGQVYSASCRITTNQGRIDDRTVTIRVLNR